MDNVIHIHHWIPLFRFNNLQYTVRSTFGRVLQLSCVWSFTLCPCDSFSVVTLSHSAGWLMISCSFPPTSINPSLCHLGLYFWKVNDPHLSSHHSPIPSSASSILKLPPGKVERADAGLIFLLLGYPAFSLLNQSHLWLIRRCVWDTVAAVDTALSLKNIPKSNHVPATDIHEVNLFLTAIWQLIWGCFWGSPWIQKCP